MSESESSLAKKKGLQRLSPELRARIADGAAVLAAVVVIAGLILPTKLDGVWLRLPVSFALIAALGAAWFVVRKNKPGIVLANGVVVGVMGISILAMALHKASGWTSLAGLLGFAAALALKTCIENPFVRARDLKVEGERSVLGVLLENVESLAAALVVVLLVWHFALEAFQIPTGSMSPTMIGSSIGRGMLTDGDRVLVDKLAYEVRDPAQWDPVVFRYPLKRTDPYVKRCVGIPGNELLIANGDVYVRQNAGSEIELLEKTTAARRVLWLPLLEEVDTRSAFVKNFKTDGSVDFEDGEFQIGADSRVVYPKGDGDDEAEVTDHDASFGASGTPKGNYNKGVVNDLRVVGQVDIDDDGHFYASIVRDADTYIFGIGPDGEATIVHEREGDTKSLTTDEMKAFDSSAPYDIDYSIADGRLKLIVDDEELASFEVGTALLDRLRLRDKESKLSLSSQDAINLAGEPTAEPRRGRLYLSGECRFTLEKLQRDIYYQGRFLTPRTPGGKLEELPFGVTLEDEQYFVLGDNSPGSEDCRFWTQIELWMKDGTQHVGSIHGSTQKTLAKWLYDAGKESGQSAMEKLISVAHYSAEERGPESLNDTELVHAALSDLRMWLKSQNRLTLPFYNVNGGIETIDAAEIKNIQVRRIPYVKRELFAGRPFAVFLSPRGLKLID
ncbi:MAG: signal peptidase I [Planctomycetota bacterium]